MIVTRHLIGDANDLVGILKILISWLMLVGGFKWPKEKGDDFLKLTVLGFTAPAMEDTSS